MKRGFLSKFVSFIAFTLLLLFSVKAAVPTIVNGHVYQSDGITPASSIKVKVNCNNLDLFDITNNKGYYFVEFFSDCDKGSIVTVTAANVTGLGSVSNEIFGKNIVYINLRLPEIFPPLTKLPSNKFHLLQIKSLFLEKETVKPGNNLIVYTRIKNEGTFKERNAIVRITIPELGLIEQSSIRELKSKSQRLKIFTIEIPKDTKEDYYSLKVQVFNQNSQETESAQFKVI
jgi:hypothetical protein